MSASPPNVTPKPEPERLAGLVERVTFHNADNRFCVLRLKVKGERDLITLIGHAPTVSPGEYPSASGTWVTDREHGRQFKAAFVKISPPNTLTGIERYLGSGMVKGIGPVYASRLVKAFGADVFDVIEQTPARLREVDGIGEIRARKITSGWADQKIIREIMVFHIRGIGFLTADTIAQKTGIARDALIRARAGVSCALSEAAGEGHCGLPRTHLVSLAVKLLDIPEAIIEMAIDEELSEGVVVADTLDDVPSVFLAPLYNAERSIVSQIRRLRTGSPSWGSIDAVRAIPWVEQKLAIELAESQKQAIRLALSSKLLVITGGPGVGKTTLVNSILAIFAHPPKTEYLH